MSKKKNIKSKNKREINYFYFIILAAFGSLILRFILLGLPEDLFYIPDHMNTWAWWRHSIEYGILDRYGHDREKYHFTFHPTMNVTETVQGPDGRIYKPGDIIKLPEREWSVYPNNYPPLNVYIRHMMGLFHRFIDPSMEPLTPVTWLILELPTYIADIILALGCMFIVRHYRDEKWGFIAYLSMLFLPPFLFTGVFWGQCDSWFLAPAIWSVYFCIKEKWYEGGILFAVGLMAKPQTLIMCPALAYFFFSRKDIKAFGKFSLTALLSVTIMSLPFMMKNGLTWFENSYIYNFTELMPYSTLKAFNIWMIDMLRCHDLDIKLTILGISKKTWGLILLVMGLMGSFISVWKRYKNDSLALPILIALTFTATFLFPTRVHERYIIYLLPFLLLSAFIEKRFWLPLTGYTIIACFETTVQIWLKKGLNLQGASGGQIFLSLICSIAGLMLFIYWIVEIWRHPFCAIDKKNGEKKYE